MLGAAAAMDIEIVPLMAAAATPGGLVKFEAFQALRESLLTGLRNLQGQQRLDAVCLSLHGSMLAEGVCDPEGDLVRSIRSTVGASVPIGAVFDMHANISDATFENLSILTANQTYPHIDHFERGWEAVDLIRQIVSGRAFPTKHMQALDIKPPSITQATMDHPMRTIMQVREQLLQRPPIMGVTATTGFRWSGQRDRGICVIAIANKSHDAAKRASDELTDAIRRVANDFRVELLPPQEAVSRARTSALHPVVLADTGDNPGGGGMGDDTSILRELLEQRVVPSALAAIADPNAVHVLSKAGPGRRMTIPLGGPWDEAHKRLCVTGTVRLVCDGTYVNRGPMRQGDSVRMGATVLLDCDGVQVLVCERPVQPWDPEVFRMVGVDPLSQRALVVKSSVHFRAAFGPLAKGGVYLVDTPGLTRPLYPR